MELLFHGKRDGNNGNIELTVLSWVRDVEENFFIRQAFYSGQKTTWKEIITIKDLGASPRGMNWRVLFKNCEASLGELNPLEGLEFELVIFINVPLKNKATPLNQI